MFEIIQQWPPISHTVQAVSQTLRRGRGVSLYRSRWRRWCFLGGTLLEHTAGALSATREVASGSRGLLDTCPRCAVTTATRIENKKRHHDALERRVPS